MRRFLLPLIGLLALAGCVQAIAESRVRSALSEAGLNDRVSDCMAGRMVDRLTIEQLKKLERLKTRADERDPVTVSDYLSRVARVGDAEVVGVTSSSAALCATGSLTNLSSSLSRHTSAAWQRNPPRRESLCPKRTIPRRFTAGATGRTVHCVSWAS